MWSGVPNVRRPLIEFDEFPQIRQHLFGIYIQIEQSDRREHHYIMACNYDSTSDKKESPLKSGMENRFLDHRIIYTMEYSINGVPEDGGRGSLSGRVIPRPLKVMSK